MDLSTWLIRHWESALTGLAAFLGMLGSRKAIPTLWRRLASFLAAPVLLEIEREKNRAREEQVADLLEELEWRRKHGPIQLPEKE